MRLDAQQASAFRLSRQHLDRRLPAGSLLAAVDCGIQNTPPGSAELAMHARLEGLSPGLITQALEGEKSLLQAWSLRGAPYIFQTEDAATFTQGLLPEIEDEIRAFIGGVDPILDKVGITAVQMLDLCSRVAAQALDEKALTKDQLGLQVAALIQPCLTADQLRIWQESSWITEKQTLGESVVRFFFPLLALQGILCHAERVGDQAYFRLTQQWLGTQTPEDQPENARSELVRRYLRYYGPSTVEHFAAWAGIALSQAQTSWRRVESELAPVDFQDHHTWILASDGPNLQSASLPQGIRFLPPHDPYLSLRDRETIFPDRQVQKQVWRMAGNPGVLLIHGQACGIWRPQKVRNRLSLQITLLREVSKNDYPDIEGEAQLLAPLRGCNSVEIHF